MIYTRRGGYIYALLVKPLSGVAILDALSSGSSSVGKVRKVEMLETGKKLAFKQGPEGLEVMTGQAFQTAGINDRELAEGFKVLKISYERNWFNDDDPGVSTYGWDRKCNLDDGSFNNDISFSDMEGDTWSLVFKGKRVRIIAPGGMDGKMGVLIDGKDCGTVDFSGLPSGNQLTVFKSGRLKGGDHSIKLVNLGGSIAVDALVIE